MKQDWKEQLANVTGYQQQKGTNYSKDNQLSKVINFYEDNSKEKINIDLLDKKAKEWALSFIRPERPRDRYMKNPKLSSAQIRRFHNDVRELEAKVEAAGQAGFHRMLPLIKMMKSKVAYACPSDGRERKVPDEFRTYMETMINSIHDKKDFEAFSLCFEAVVGYFFGEGGR